MTSPRPLRLLTPLDREWALDNSRRAYRVRRSEIGDPGLAQKEPRPWPAYPDFITIVRLSDGFRIPLTATCSGTRMLFNDSDAYAEHRLDIVNRARRARGEVEV